MFHWHFVRIKLSCLLDSCKWNVRPYTEGCNSCPWLELKSTLCYALCALGCEDTVKSQQTWFKSMDHYQAFIWIRCVGAGKHPKHRGKGSTKARIEEHWFKLKFWLYRTNSSSKLDRTTKLGFFPAQPLSWFRLMFLYTAHNQQHPQQSKRNKI